MGGKLHCLSLKVFRLKGSLEFSKDIQYKSATPLKMSREEMFGSKKVKKHKFI
jgi:hypothetical protein